MSAALAKAKTYSPEDSCDGISRVLWRLCLEPDASTKSLPLLESGLVRFDYCDEINEQTFCHKAAMNGALHVLKAASVNISSIDAADYYNRRPLHYAAMNGHVDCVKFLLEQGADGLCRDDDGNRPLDYAVMSGYRKDTPSCSWSH